MTSIKSTKGTLWVAWSIIFCLGSSMVSCAASQTELTTGAAPQAESGNQDLIAEESLDQKSSNVVKTPDGQVSSIPRQVPQLIKTAHLTLKVKDVEQSLDIIVGKILNGQRGDVLDLQDQQPQREGDRHTATLQMRVPQENLNQTLTELDGLGTVERRSIKAQDVSNQIVDSKARLKNLRKSEEMVLKIMDRSGSIPDVLSASQELTKIRENIERIDAQLQNLQGRVAFSTINLRLESIATSSPPKSGVGFQVQETWKRSTNAMADLTIAFVKLGVWGIAFSPYLIAIGLLIWLARHQLQRSPRLQTEKLGSSESSSSESSSSETPTFKS